MENILVAGANGTTGRKIVNLLNDSDDYQPIALVRKIEQMDHFSDLGVEAIIGDLEGDLSHVTDNVDKVIFAAGSGGKKVVAVDQEGAKKLVDVSKQAGIKKFVMLSSMGADQPEKAEQLQDYLRAKHNADVYLRDSGLNYTIVRPGELTNEGGLNYISLEKKLEEQGQISRADVAKTLVMCLNDEVGNEVTFEIIKGDTLISDAVNKLNK